MKTLVIGATGYLGAHVGKALSSAGMDVTGLTRHVDEDRIAFIGKNGMKVLAGDMVEEGAFPNVVPFDAIVFAPQLLMNPEQAAVRRILDALEGTGKVFIFTSGTGVLGQRTMGAWSQDSFAEDDPFVPLRAIAKRAETENIVRAAERRGVRAMVIRPPRVWGYGARGPVSMTYESVARTGAACFVGEGLNLYSSVHVDDLCDLYVKAVLSGTAGALYHAVGGEIPNRWIAECVARDMGCQTRSVDMDEAMKIWGRYQTLIVLSVSSRSRAVRSRHELDWSPHHTDMLTEVGLMEFRELAYKAPQSIVEGRMSTALDRVTAQY
ncbi:nucleoside-diphosphate sugar epimerase [Sphingobium sp. SCG-1]|uniref:NAD-dependent epimerase/dehydratase family protein n=1 Tax=Sphingobium sp. SCG-1 TaxID=2072936 RepID=UPI000CD6A94B|nr:NAD-dependent epimerase/dehydratase family protein [Sphingobium sp. SCG-1]AUW57162.1 nucleoside-diphosphate sugar epimerase [Sphingobium sp. SCG-1]